MTSARRIERPVPACFWRDQRRVVEKDSVLRKGFEGIQRTLPGEMREATLSTCGDYASFTRTAEFLGNAFSYPWTVEDIWINYYATYMNGEQGKYSG